MRKKLVLMVALLVVTMFCGNVIASSGPAPNSGDGIPDGSGMESQIQNGEPSIDSPGPAPNSGDGVSDGSGF
ncbi:hypothetical protein HOD20_01305 [archaeon]|nr:hypothetical protein [archaeon]MBT4351141.1 hypothetical protein [archaeon]MBT4647367.1 hypothetical protein [archaeon]MBT6821197.1 hypothetical protein [archaeon]MBT7391249.1 hypothetical protein [archaeon]